MSASQVSPFRIQRDGMLMPGIQFTAGEHEFQLFHQQWKSPVQMVCIRIAEPASDTGAVCKVMQPVTPPAPDVPRNRASRCRAAPPGAVFVVVGKRCPGECV